MDVNFTGAIDVKHKIAGMAARQLKPLLLALSGKVPFVVLYDANLEAAVAAAALGPFSHQGHDGLPPNGCSLASQ